MWRFKMTRIPIMWVVLGNSSFVEFYSVEGNEITKRNRIDFPEGRMKDNLIVSDRPGRGFDSMGGSRHSYGTQVDIHSHERSIFAHKIIDLLSKGQNERAFDQLAIIAPPEFLGELRRLLPESLQKLVKKELGKDLPESLSEKDRLDHIYKLLEIKKPQSAQSAWQKQSL